MVADVKIACCLYTLFSVVKNTFKKYFNYKLQNTFFKSVSITFVNYFGQVAQNTKYKILLTKVIEIQNTFRSHCESIMQSINEYLFSKKEKHKHIFRLGIGTVPATVQCMVNKKKHRK